jgi:23S rRNA (uracil1939-C5)-methyltransferase
MLPALRELIMGMHARDRLPQIELAMGDSVCALVLRHLEPLSAADLARLRGFAAEHGVQWWLQSAGPDSAAPLETTSQTLRYALPDFGVELPFRPTDFTQVNLGINRVLVSHALRWLAVQPGDRVVDWFCGLGNFTLPIATRAGHVLGVEGSESLVRRARENAAVAGLDTRSSFEVRNLFELSGDALCALGVARRWLVDPPREGAFALVKALADVALSRTPTWQAPERIVYVSCNPATLARDAGLLVHQAGYQCIAAGVVDMFPHTAHVESMAVFDRS